MTKKSPFIDFCVKAGSVIEKALFIGMIVAMIALLSLQPVNIVNWGFLILLYILLITKLIIRVDDIKEINKKRAALKCMSKTLIYYTILTIFLQTIF